MTSSTATAESGSDQQPEDAPAADAADRSVDDPRWVASLRRFATTTWLARLIELLALVPFGAMVVEVVRSPMLHFVDYWYALLRFIGIDGSLNVAGFFKASNEHLIAVPSLMYYIDATVFGGNQRILGYAVVVIALATVLVVRVAIPKSLPPVVRASIVFATSALIFSLHGLHNFTHSMSGAAWLTANLVSVIALVVAARGRWWPAIALGLLASITYGTGFAVWPSLALLAFLRGERWWRRLLPLVLGVLIVAPWMLLNHDAAGSNASGDVGTLLFGLFAVVGKIWSANNAGIAVLAGAIVLAGYAAMATVKTARAPELRFWWALGCHGFFGCAMIAVSRIDFGLDYSQHSRYTSVSVLVSLPLLVIVGTVVHRLASRQAGKIAIGLVVAGALGFALGVPTADVVRRENSEHEMKSVALRAGLYNAFGWALPGPDRDLVPRLEALGHYPFNDDFTLGCGGPELGDRLDLAGADEIEYPRGGRTPASPAGNVDRVDQQPGAQIVYGWATGVNDPVRCTVIVDTTGRITGGGVSHLTRSDIAQQLLGINPDTGFAMVGPDDDDARVVVILESGALRWMPVETSDTDD